MNYLRLSCASLVAAALAMSAFGAGCASPTDDSESSSDALTAGLHEPQGDERKAIFDAFRVVLDKDLQGQQVVFNSTDPVGRYQAHGDWASYEGILEGANGNTKPINYTKSVYKDASEGGYLDGVQRNGHFAAKFFGMAHKGADGKWKVATDKNKNPAYAVGPGYDAWTEWAGLPAIAQRDVSRAFPKDDLHEPEGAERTAILDALHATLAPDLHNQSCIFNSTDPKGSFLEHDGWAYYEGIIEGPNGNVTAINYQNSAFKAKSGAPGFEGVLRNGNFAAKITALLQKKADGSWKVSAQTHGGTATTGYAVGASSNDVGEVGSQFAYDVYPGGEGEGGEGGD